MKDNPFIRYNALSTKFLEVIKNPTICPKCKIVYSHSNPIAECKCCNWKNKGCDKTIDDDPILNINEDRV